MSSKSHFFDDVRVDHLEVGAGVVELKLCATEAGEVGTMMLDNTSNDLRISAKTDERFAAVKIVDDQLYISGAFETDGSAGAGTTGGLLRIFLDRIPGISSANFRNFKQSLMPVGTVRASNQDTGDFFTGHVVLGDSGGQLRFVGNFADVSGPTLDTEVNLSSGDIDFTSTATTAFSFSAVVPIARVDH